MGKLFLYSGDYIENSKNMDAIVNSSNEYMISGSGICGAVYRNAGAVELTNYCKNNFPKRMAPEEVRITPGFNLKMNIIHVLAPKFYQEEKPIEVLKIAYNNMMREILKNNYKNILVCSLGTGIHGYKHEDVANEVISLLQEWCNCLDANIYFNNINPTVKDIYLKEYLMINNIDLKKDLLSITTVEDMINYLIRKNLIENNIIEKYKDFVYGKELEELCLSEKIICLQYLLEKHKLPIEQLQIIIKSM